MAWVAVDEDKTENIGHSLDSFERVTYEGEQGLWGATDIYEDPLLELPKGSIEKLIGRKLTWEDEPVELKEE